MSVAVTALDETSVPTESKTEPVIGIWSFGDPQGTPPPAFTSSPFNSETFAMSRLDAQILSSNSFIIGIADLRGDGRPDYHYHAHVLYGDSVTPARVPVNGGAITLQGTGFSPSLAIAMGNRNLPVLATNASQMLATVPAQPDGAQTLTISDPASGAFSTMTGVLTFGAAATDRILLLQGGNPPTPVGTQATNPVTVRVLASDGITPVSGATVGWTTTNGVLFSICGGASTCSAISDESGIASTLITPNAPGNATITATLAPGVYNPASSVSATLEATSSALDIGVTTPYLWIASGASLSLPLTARVVNLGTGLPGKTVDFFIDQGVGSLSAGSAVTNSSGYASVTLTLTNFTASVQVSACVAPANNPCQTIYGNAVASAMMNLQAVAGAGQVISGKAFQPLTIRVVDSSSPPNAVLAASVLFQSTVMRPAGDALGPGDSTVTAGMPVILSSSQSSVLSDINGLASIVPSVGLFTGPLQVEIQISAGTNAALLDELQAFPATGSGNTFLRGAIKLRPE